MMRFAVAGNPVNHSLSPVLFRAAYGNSEDSYGLIEAKSAEEVVERFRDDGYDGINVTAPFKEDIIGFVDVRSELDIAIGAANTLLMRNGLIYSFNTDFNGVQECIKPFVGSGKEVLVIGCGGAGKAAALAAAGLKCRVTVINRSFEKAQQFAENHSLAAGRLNDLITLLCKSDIIINTLPSNLELIDRADFSGKIVLEANYQSPQIGRLPFINKSTNYISGKYWLLHQAVDSFRLFKRTEPDFNSMLLFIENI